MRNSGCYSSVYGLWMKRLCDFTSATMIIANDIHSWIAMTINIAMRAANQGKHLSAEQLHMQAYIIKRLW